MQISMFIIPIILAILGVLIRFGKASFLISGYNTSSKQEKEKYDEKALCNFVGNFSFVLAGIVLLIVVADTLNLPYLKVIATILLIIIIIAAGIYANTGNRFEKL